MGVPAKPVRQMTPEELEDILRNAREYVELWQRNFGGQRRGYHAASVHEHVTGPSIPRGDVERYHAAAIELAEAARRIVTPAVEAGFEVETKPDASLVTDVDHAVERRLRELIGRWFPDHGVIGEEYPPPHPESA